MAQLVEWDSLNLRISGERIDALSRELTAAEPAIEALSLRFFPGLLRIDGVFRKFFAIKFSVEIDRILASGTTLRMPLARISVGTLPVPTLLLSLVRDRFPPDVMTLEPPATLVISLDRFLPSFVIADVREIRIIDGGLAVALGAGGADIPPGGPNGSGRRTRTGNV